MNLFLLACEINQFKSGGAKQLYMLPISLELVVPQLFCYAILKQISQVCVLLFSATKDYEGN